MKKHYFIMDEKEPKPTVGKLYNPDKHRTKIKHFDKILEIHKQNISLKLDNTRAISKVKWNQEGEMVLSNIYEKSFSINENKEGEATFVPRFTMKKYKNKVFAKFPPNKEIKYDRDLMVLAMEFGMILQIQYRGEEDNFARGRTRVIYPMCLGTSSKGKPLLRAYHLSGWSHSENGSTGKVWRMFRTDRIMSMSFTGSFFRLLPDQYNANDKGMRGGIIKSVDLQEVRSNQRKLADEGTIQNKKEVILDEKRGKIVVIEALDTESVLDLQKPFDNPNIDEDNKKLIRLTFLKSQVGNKRISILGALGKRGNIVKVSSTGKFLGTFRVIKHVMGDALNKPHLKRLEGKSKYDLHIFVKKRN